MDESLPHRTRAAALAHELWHALEVAREPDVIDGRSFEALYQHIGHGTVGHTTVWYDTKGAVRVGVPRRQRIHRKRSHSTCGVQSRHPKRPLLRKTYERATTRCQEKKGRHRSCERERGVHHDFWRDHGVIHVIDCDTISSEQERTVKHEVLNDLIDNSVSRRKFAKSAITAGFGIGAASLVSGTISTASAQSITDADILNFALNLEYLEAEFYTVITSGVTIDQAPFNIGITGVGTPGPTTGAGRLDFGGNQLLQQTALELAFDEREHVKIIRGALGSAAIAKPAINFAAAAVTTVPRFLQVARVLEDLGVSAYGGAAPLLTSKDILAVATRIALVEALHAGNVRFQMAAQRVSDIGPVDASDIIVGTPGRIGARLITADAIGLTPVRTPGQVLSVAYGPGAPAGTSAGLLFPNGVNGLIRTV